MKPQPTFESGCDVVDVTSAHRPDTAAVIVDSHGHRHEWHTGGQPATGYNTSATYDMPSLVWIKDGEEYYEDDDQPHDIGHYECRECGERINPRYCADTFTQFAPGLRWFKINGRHVSEEEFTSAYAAFIQER